MPSPYHFQDVFLPQSLPDLFTSHSVQSAHSLKSSQHTHLGSLHSPFLLLCQAPHLTAVPQGGQHCGIDYLKFCVFTELLPSQHHLTYSSNHSCSTCNPCLHTLPPLSYHHYLIMTPKYFISSTCSITLSPILTSHFPLYLHHFGLLSIHFQVPFTHGLTQHLQIAL